MRAGLNQESLSFQSKENFVSKNQETLSNEMSKVFFCLDLRHLNCGIAAFSASRYKIAESSFILS